MIKIKSVIRGSWGLRNLSMLADRATIGLDRYLQEKPSTELIQDGIKFCGGMSGILAMKEPSEQGKAQLQYSKDTPLTERTLIQYLEHRGFNREAAAARFQQMENLLQGIVTAPNARIGSEVITSVQEELFAISRFFFCSDAENLHRLKERRSLKAYG